MKVTRRGLILGGTALVGAGLLTDTLTTSFAAEEPHIDLAGPRSKLATLTLPGPRTQQGFCFNADDPRDMFVAQPLGSEANGDLIVRRYTLTPAGLAHRGHMTLRGFGHGESLAAYQHGGHTYLWTEADALKRLRVKRDGTVFYKAFGTAFAAVRFRAGAEVHSRQPSPGVTVYRDLVYQTVTPGVDPYTRRLLLHHSSSDGTRAITAYPLDEMRPRHSSALPASTIFPSPPSLGLPQGWAVKGDFLYTLEGRARGYDDTWLRAYHLKTGTPVQNQHLGFARTWASHEPEGLTIRKADNAQLFFCITSHQRAPHPSHLYYLEKPAG